MAKKKRGSETGWFPAFTPKGKPIRMHGEQLNELRLRCIKDGTVRSFVDDGQGVDGPNGRRGELLRRMNAKDADRFPLFFADSPVDPVRGVEFGGEVPVRSKEIDEAMQRYLAIRAQRNRTFAEHAARERQRIHEKLTADRHDVAPKAPTFDDDLQPRLPEVSP